MAEHGGYAQVRREHQELLQGLRVVSHLLEAEPGPGAVSPWAERLGGELDTLQAHLESHFAHEEAGFYRTIRTERPTTSRTLDALQHEHGVFLRDLAGFKERALTAGATVRYDEVKAELRRWLRRLREHERRETELLVESVMQDMGTQD